MRTYDRNSKDNSDSYFWKQKISWSLEIEKKKKKGKMPCFDLKVNIWKVKKHIAPMDFVEYPRKTDVSENREVYYGRFLGNGLHER